MKTREIKSRWWKRFLARHTKLYKDYLPVKEVFVEPKLMCKIGLWRHDNCLPVWRRGNTIRLYNKNKMLFQTEERFIEFPKKSYMSRWETVWTKEFKKKHPIRALFKPHYNLPLWLSFYKFNHGAMWKTKWDDYRFEFAPQFTLVIFGISISFWLHEEDWYWESILYYTDPCEMSGRAVYDKCLSEFRGDIEGTGKRMGIWSTTNKPKGEEKFYALDPRWLKEPFKTVWELYIEENPANPKPVEEKKKRSYNKKKDGNKTTEHRKSTKKVDKKTPKKKAQKASKNSK